jgi:hypothetical protein
MHIPFVWQIGRFCRQMTEQMNIAILFQIIITTTKPLSIGRRFSRIKTFAGIDSTCVSVLSGTIRPIDTGFVVYSVMTSNSKCQNCSLVSAAVLYPLGKF